MRDTASPTTSTMLAFGAIVICAIFMFDFNRNIGNKSNFQLTKDESLSNFQLAKDESLSNFQLAKDESFGFFDDVPYYQWEEYKKIVSMYIPHKRENPFDVGGKANVFYQENYEPNFSCPFELRIGANGDGGKWVCDPHRIKRIAKEHGDCLIYSVGSDGDFSFEEAVQKYFDDGKLCEVHIFDMGSYGDIMPKNLNLHYHQWGFRTAKPSEKVVDGKLVSTIEPDQEFYSFAETIKLLGHEGRRAIDLFKIDCERCEWETYKEWVGPSIPNISQIQVEVHGYHENTLPFFDDLMNDGYAIFHKEPNIIRGGGICIEFAFLKLEKSFFGMKQL